jgi:hypothetical protein
LFNTRAQEFEQNSVASSESMNPSNLPSFDYPFGWQVFAISPSYLRGEYVSRDLTMYLNDEPIELDGDSGFPKYSIAILNLSQAENANRQPSGTIETTETRTLGNGALTIMVGYFDFSSFYNDGQAPKITYEELVFNSNKSDRAIRVIYYGGQDNAWKLIKNSLDFSKLR